MERAAQKTRDQRAPSGAPPAWCVRPTARAQLSVRSVRVVERFRKPAIYRTLLPSHLTVPPAFWQSGWGDLFADKYEEVLDESTGEMIMVEKGAKKYKLDAQGNIISRLVLKVDVDVLQSDHSAGEEPNLVARAIHV